MFSVMFACPHGGPYPMMHWIAIPWCNGIGPSPPDKNKPGGTSQEGRTLYILPLPLAGGGIGARALLGIPPTGIFTDRTRRMREGNVFSLSTPGGYPSQVWSWGGTPARSGGIPARGCPPGGGTPARGMPAQGTPYPQPGQDGGYPSQGGPARDTPLPRGQDNTWSTW